MILRVPQWQIVCGDSNPPPIPSLTLGPMLARPTAKWRME